MKNRIAIVLLLVVNVSLFAQKEVKLKIVETSDIHGNYYPYDFIFRHKDDGGLANIYSFVQQKRSTYKDNLILLDNGDILQGQPTSYYYNYIDTVSPHLAAEMMNFMGYDAGNMGNHDVETGHLVFDRWARQCHFPILGANIIDTLTNKPYFQPYITFKREGVKIVVLGMITPAIPMWLAENLWSGLRFDDMEETARKWISIIRRKEKPDLIIGLFHSGKGQQIMGEKYRENASRRVARNVPGFDVVLIGHDHTRYCDKIVNVAGDSVLIMDPANNGFVVSDVDVTVRLNAKGKVVDKKIRGVLSEMKDYEAGPAFTAHFLPQYKAIEQFTNKTIGKFTKAVSLRPAFFGPSAFIDLIHSLQLEIGKADISFTAPIAYDAEIQKGCVRVRDMFALYRYENMLYTMKLSGREVKGALEMSYALWTNQMHSPKDHLLLLNNTPQGSKERALFVNSSFNFDSAAGIIYTVDVTKPEGEKVHIISMADGSPFYLDKIYKVALNSYRGNGGGELLTKGAGIPKEELKKRIIFSTDRDLRYYLMQYMERKKVITPHALNQWKFIPEAWTKPAIMRDSKLIQSSSGELVEE